MILPSNEVLAHEIRMLEWSENTDHPEYTLALLTAIMRSQVDCEKRGTDWREGLSYDEVEKAEFVMSWGLEWLETLLETNDREVQE